MSYPILYSPTETSFDNNGIGILSSCVFCQVTEEANGAFELVMQYPMDGIHFSSISDRSIIKAKADQFREPQLFRVYGTKKQMTGIVTIFAQHISYDLSGIPVKPFYAENADLAMEGFKKNAVVECPFSFWTDLETVADFSSVVPSSIRSLLGGKEGSVLDVYGGELEFDNQKVKLHKHRGENRGVSIRYGKNLTNIQQEQNCSNVITGIYPYWFSETEEQTIVVELPEKIINTPGDKNFVRVVSLDLTAEFDEQPTVEQLRDAANKYIKEHELGVPVVSLAVSYAQLDQMEEYRHLAMLDRVGLFDTVSVEFPALGVSATARAVKTVYDVLADRMESVVLGSVRTNIADTIIVQQKQLEKAPSKIFIKTAIDSLTHNILGAKGGSVRFLDEDGDGEPDTLYIADDPDPEVAETVWRFNHKGWGASEHGYNGPFELGATLSGGIVANFITAGELDADKIDVVNLNAGSVSAGSLKSSDESTYFDLDNDTFVSEDETGKTEIKGGNIAVYDLSGQKRLAITRTRVSNSRHTFELSVYDGDGNAIFSIVSMLDGSAGIACENEAGTKVFGKPVIRQIRVNDTDYQVLCI